MREELVTIIIPVYNGKRYVIDALESCRIQTYKNIEVIVIDDCSLDNSYEVLSAYKNTLNKDFLLLRNKVNIGVLRTLNKGISLACGSKIIALGQDDILDRHHVETMIKYFDEDTSFVYCGSEYIDSNGNILNSNIFYKYNGGEIEKLTGENRINSCGLMFSKEKVVEVGMFEFNLIYPNYGEWLFWLKLKSVGKIKFCSKIKSFYRRHDMNMTNSFSESLVKKNLKKYFKRCLGYIYNNYYPQMSLREKVIFWIRMVKNSV